MKSKHDILNSAKIKEKKRALVKRRIVIWSIIFMLLIAGLAYVSQLSALTISKIVISGNAVTDGKAVEENIQKHLSGKYAHLFAKNNFLLYPDNAIEQDILDTFTRIQSVEAKLADTNTLEISLVEYEPAYLWCGIDTPTEAPSGNCYFLNEDGYIFSVAPNFSGNVYFKLYGSPTGAQEMLRTTFLPIDEFKRLIAFKKALEDNAIRVASLFADANGDYTLYVEGSAARILFRKENDFQKILGNLLAALGTEPLAGQVEQKFAGVSYVDLRYDNKVYYKFSK